MRRAYNRLKSIQHKNTIKEWEPLMNNLGHVCRKLKYELFDSKKIISRVKLKL